MSRDASASLGGFALVCAIVGIPLVLWLASGRLDVQEKQIHDCRVEGQLAFLRSGQIWSEDGTTARGIQYIALCMDSNGYSFNFAGKFCQPLWDGGQYSNKYCYRSKQWKLLTDIDIAMNGGFENWPDQLWCDRFRTLTQAYCVSRGWFPD